MNDIRYCPQCNFDLQGEQIPEEHRHLFGEKTHFSKLIGISDMLQDRITHWRCPNCHHEWKRT